jgi:PKD repeat protein
MRRFKLLLIFPILFFVGCDSGGSSMEQENQAPSASFSVDNQEPRAGTAVSFTANASDPDGSVESYEWDFGDGSSASGSSVSHTYDELGTYDIQLTVTDGEGASSSATQTIDVQQQYTQATVTEVRIQDMPFSNDQGQGWDPFSGPDPYYVAANLDTGSELAASGFYEDVGESNLPLQYPDTEWTISDLSERHLVSIYDSDSNEDDFISGIEFDLSQQVGTYSETVTLDIQDTTIELSIDWQE